MFKRDEWDNIVSRDNKPITSKFIIKEMNEAIKQFGEYTFGDKGPDEVMDLPPIVEELRKLPATDVGLILMEVTTAHDMGEILTEYLVSSMDDMPDTWFSEVLKISGANY